MGKPPPPRKPPRRRPPQTIELEATEVRVEPPRDVPPPEPEVTVTAAEPETPPATSAEEPVASAPEEPHVTAPPPMPRFEPPPAREAPRYEPPPRDPPPPPPPPPRSPWLAAAAGGGAVLVVLLTLLILGVIGPRDQLSARLSSLETQLARRLDQPSADPKSIEDIATRVARIEAVAGTPRPAEPDPALISRLGSIEVAVKSLGDAAANINSRNEDVTAALRAAREQADAIGKRIGELQALVEKSGTFDKSELDKLAGRLAALESSTRTVEQKIETPGSTAADRDVRMAVLAAALKDAVERGTPYLNELNAIRSLVKDTKLIAALDPFASSGAPTPAVLSSELRAIVPALAQAAAPQARDGSVLDRLQANASRLVKVRPIDAPVGDEPDNIVQRVDANAQRGSVAGALAELAKLPAPMRAPAEGWIARAQARDAAVKAAQAIATDTYGALARPAH